MRLVLASRNEHKLLELTEMLLPFELAPLPAGVELPPETGRTFAENALAKARAAALATGDRSVADDSGIEAAALGGAPGVRSARYAGEGATDEQNLAKLLREVEEAVAPRRGAGAGDPGDRAVAYVSVLAYAEPGGAEWLAEGRCEGTLAGEPRGSGGFGYDPAFLPIEHRGELTMAELTSVQKAAISHRGRAARALLSLLEERGAA